MIPTNTMNYAHRGSDERGNVTTSTPHAALPPPPSNLLFHYLFTVCSFSIARILMQRKLGVSVCQNHFLTRETRWK